jgi:hypothetical protein
MSRHPIIQCIKCDAQVFAKFGDISECKCGEVMLEVAAGGYLRVHTSSDHYKVIFQEEE